MAAILDSAALGVEWKKSESLWNKVMRVGNEGRLKGRADDA